jgi:SAM-dependent methyltransferase
MPAVGAYSKIYTFEANRPVIRQVPPEAARILDVGCGSGENAAALMQLKPSRRISGISLSRREADLAMTVMDEVVVADVENWTPPPDMGVFDCILLSHVLEHLQNPQALLERVVNWLAPGGCIVAAVPNVLFVEERVQFLRGRFRYTDVGIMDRTHLRFFDHFSIDDLFRKSGYRLASSRATCLMPLGKIRWKFRKFAAFADRMAERLAPDLFGWQFVIVARPLLQPSQGDLCDHSETANSKILV